MDIKNRSADSVSTFVSQSSSPGLGAMSEDQNSIKSDDLASLKVKLMCSHGGRIMPRPHDNQLRYVGGETRILVVSRNISLADLMSKLCRLCGKPVLVKYQLPNEDLDVLVSVLGDEDLDNMMEEFDRLESRDSTTRLRLFLFPAKDQNAAEAVDDSRNAEQRFLDAVNGLCSVSKRPAASSTVTPMPDFLFGLDGLVTRERNPPVVPAVASVSQATSPTVENVVLEHQPMLQIDLNANSQPQITSLALDETSIENHLIIQPTENSTLHVLEIADSIDPASEAVSPPCTAESNHSAPTYVPLVEIPRDQLPKGVVLRQFSVESSHQGSLDSGPRDISSNSSVSGPSLLQIRSGALFDPKDMKLLSGIDETDFNLSNVSPEGTEDCKQTADGSVASAERWVHEHKPEDEYPSYSTLTNQEGVPDFTDKQMTVELHEEIGGTQSNAPLSVQHGMPAKQDVECRSVPIFDDVQNISFQKPSGREASTGQEQPTLNNNVEGLQEGEKVFIQSQDGYPKEGPVFMQRRSPDAALLQLHYQQNFPTLLISSHRSNATAYWPVEEKPQLYYEGVKILPQTPGLIPKPGLTHGTTEPIASVAAAPTAVRISDGFAPNYPMPPSYLAQLQRQYGLSVIYPDQLLSLPQHQVKGVPFRDQPASQKLQESQLSSRLREQLSFGFHEHVADGEERLPRPVQPTSRQQFSYHVDALVDDGNPKLHDPSLPQVRYVENLSKIPQYQLEDPSMPLHDAGLLQLQEVLAESQLTPPEGWQHVSQSLMRN